MREEVADIFVEPNEDVLNLAAARPEGVADIIHRGIAHREEIGSGGLAQMQSVDGFLRKHGQSRVRMRAGGPLTVEGGIWSSRARFSAQRVRKSQIPSVWWDGAESFVAVEVGFFRKGESPGLAEVSFRQI